jgi:hypothetical protein
MGSLASRAVDGLIRGSLIDEVWNEIRNRLQAHFITSYHKLVDELSRKT